MTDEPVRKVSHPILRLEVLRADGTQQSMYRVFCKSQRRAVPIGECAACLRCESIEAGPLPSVNCLIEASLAEPGPDPLGLHTPVGSVLRISAYAVTPDTSVRATLMLLRAEDRRGVPVVDDAGNVIGVVDEMRCREALGHTAGAVMSSRLALPALTPVRRAVELMAAAHLREVTVVDDDGAPLGVLRDVDGLRWLTDARKHDA